ncbi:Trafficking kinesin-binding protein 1 [Liparis tanakae]|uniref:Trafficking kinesin-binding protein 1 n=1 Tax=Liparis tanakae TaxID=230148 RepID=A0A4Z2E500_9TELE|nr:Trafficking kinesin-binding protein 1 [Liparis tanakae]
MFSPPLFPSGSATLHAWQQLALPHMGAVLDDRPGVVTKGFRTLSHDQEPEDRWQLDQPEEDEASCDSFGGSSAESPALLDLPRSSSSQPDGRASAPRGAARRAGEDIPVKDGLVASVPLPFSCLSTPCSSSSSPPPPPPPLPSASEMNGHADLKELQDRTPGEGALS